jgi:large subunit ribosomal protein L10
MHVVKNRMLGRISSDLGHEGLDKLTGPTAMIVGDGDVVEVAKILKKFQTEQERDVIKGGVVEGTVISPSEVMELAKLPGKPELQGTLVGTIAAPLSGLVGVMNQKVCSLLYVLNAVKEKKEQAA